MTQKSIQNVHIARLDNSVVFKKLFRDPDVLNEFIKDLLGLDLQITANQIETEKKFTPPVGNVDIAYDIFVDDPKNRVIIEIQRVRYGNHYDRFFYYFLVAIIELVKSHRTYSMDRTVYTIVWLTRQVQDKTYQKSILTNTIETKTHTGEVIKVYPHKLFFLNPHYVDEKTPKGVADWMNLVVESLKHPTNPGLNYDRDIFHKAMELIAEDGLNPTERAEILDENAYEDTLQSSHRAGHAAGHAEGLEQGLEKGREEGLEKGREEGLEKGREKGLEEGQLQSLHRMLFLQLAQKFTDVPESVLAQIEQADDVKQLEAWMIQLVTAVSWQDVFVVEGSAG
ncbi:MAG: PD-(D/E)XK nuclease family transposase [Chloroflexota bacterium]